MAERHARVLARLVRQQAQDAREAERAQAAAPPRKPGGAELSRRISAVRDAVTRVIWHEVEDDESAAWLAEMLDEGIASDCLRDDFCAEPLDDHIARLCLEMGLSEDAALGWRDLPKPTPVPDEDDDPDVAVATDRPMSSSGATAPELRFKAPPDRRRCASAPPGFNHGFHR